MAVLQKTPGRQTPPTPGSEKNIFIKKRKLQDYLVQKGFENRHDTSSA
jgi:hypothetical protein